MRRSGNTLHTSRHTRHETSAKRDLNSPLGSLDLEFITTFMIGNAKPGFVKIRDTMRGVNSQQDSIAQLRRYRWTPSTMLGPLLFLLACHGALPAILRSSQLKLSRSTMAMSLTAAELSRLVYDSNPSDAGWKQFTFFDDEPDQAIVASQRGVCYVAFRGTTQTWEDWLSNLNLADHQVCDSGRCCTTRLGIWESFAADYQQKLEKKLLRCTRRCKDRDRCVVLTGHSQGGSTGEFSTELLDGLRRVAD